MPNPYEVALWQVFKAVAQGEFGDTLPSAAQIRERFTFSEEMSGQLAGEVATAYLGEQIQRWGEGLE